MTGNTADPRNLPARHVGDNEPSTQEVRTELARVVASPGFDGSPQLSGFLEYLVEEFLAGRGDDIKERNIAVNALSRPVDFDPRLDSVVRVTAVRLRRALEEYYAADGAADPLRISVPKGAYLPRFDRQHAEPVADEAETQTTVVPKSRVQPDSDGRTSRVPTAFWLACILGATAIVAGIVTTIRGPSGVDIVEQTGALPWRIEDGRLQILIVRTKRDSHWTVPKATQDPEMTPQEVAEGEAWEEAGVQGSAGPHAIGEYEYVRGSKVYRVSVYPVLVAEVHDAWPEDFRDRLWCDLHAEPVPVESDQLRMIIADFNPEGL